MWKGASQFCKKPAGYKPHPSRVSGKIFVQKWDAPHVERLDINFRRCLLSCYMFKLEIRNSDRLKYYTKAYQEMAIA
jgi:hypothetical protein